MLALVVAGLPNKLVADRLGASEKTIKVHRARVIGQKMRADSLAHLARLAQVVGGAGETCWRRSRAHYCLARSAVTSPAWDEVWMILLNWAR